MNFIQLVSITKPLGVTFGFGKHDFKRLTGVWYSDAV